MKGKNPFYHALIRDRFAGQTDTASCDLIDNQNLAYDGNRLQSVYNNVMGSVFGGVFCFKRVVDKNENIYPFIQAIWGYKELCTDKQGYEKLIVEMDEESQRIYFLGKTEFLESI